MPTPERRSPVATTREALILLLLLFLVGGMLMLYATPFAVVAARSSTGPVPLIAMALVGPAIGTVAAWGVADRRTFGRGALLFIGVLGLFLTGIMASVFIEALPDLKGPLGYLRVAAMVVGPLAYFGGVALLSWLRWRATAQTPV